MTKARTKREDDNLIVVRGARQNNLRNIDVSLPRNSLVVFTGVSGSGKSSLAFGTIYAEAQRRYFDSINPYARRLMSQLPAPHVTDITGLPPAIALQQRRADPTARSSVGTLTKLSNTLRMLYSRAGEYPRGAERLDSDAFSANTVAGACEECHGVGVIHSVSERSLVPDPSLTIREGAIAAWPGAWQGKNLRDILATLGYDVDKPWRDLPKKVRDWILFTDEKPVVTVYAEREAHRIQRPYQGTYMSAANYVMHTFANTQSATLRKRAAKFMETQACTACGGKRLKRESLEVKFMGRDIAETAQMPLKDLDQSLSKHKAKEDAASLMVQELRERISLLAELGLDYLSLSRPSQTLSSGELQRLRLATQLGAGLFGVVYVLDEPSAGLHPADTEALTAVLRRLLDAGNSLLIVEHEVDVIQQSDWVIDMGPGAGDLGGELLFSGPTDELKKCKPSETRRFIFDAPDLARKQTRLAKSTLQLSNINRHNLVNLTVEFPLGTLTVVTGVSGSGKSTLVSQVLHDTVTWALGGQSQGDDDEADEAESDSNADEKDDKDQLDNEQSTTATHRGLEGITRLVSVNQKPIGRTPRSNLATYTGLFDQIRKQFASTSEAKARKYNAGRFSFNVSGGRCEACEGEGFVSVELLFLPRVYSPCATCKGTRYNEETLEIEYRSLNIAEVLDLTVDRAAEFFAEVPSVGKPLKTVHDVGLGYLRLGQPATELSGGEAQRIKLATELQRGQAGHTLYLLDEPTTGLHPADVEKLTTLLHALVDAGNTVVVVEHDMRLVAQSDWVIDLGPGGGAAGGKIVAKGTPHDVAKSKSKTARYLAAVL